MTAAAAGNSRFITIASLGMVSFGIVLTTLGASLPLVIERFGIGMADAGGLLALLSFGVLAGSLAFGPIVDRRGYKGMLTVAFASIILGLETIAIAPSIAVLRLALLVVGFTGGMVNGGVNALVGDVSGPARSSALTFVGAFFGVGAAGVPLLLTAFSGALPYSAILALSGAFVVIPLVLTARTTFPSSKQPHGFPVHDARRLLGNRLLLVIGVMLFLESGMETTTGGWTPALFVQELGVPIQRAPIFLSLFWLGLLLGRLALSVVLRTASASRVVLTSIVVALAGALLLLTGGRSSVAGVGVFLLGAGFAATFPVMFGVIGERFAHLSGTALGIVMAMALLGGTVLPYLTGVLAATYGLRASFVLVPVSLVILGGLVAAMSRRLWPAAILFLLLVVPSARAQDATGTIGGTISLRGDSAAGIAVEHTRAATGAKITVLGSSLGAVADARGAFTIAHVPVGNHTLRIRMIGFRTVDRVVRVTSLDTTRVDVALEADPHLLGTVSVDARSVDREMFETRPSVGTLAISASQLSAAPRVGERDVIRAVQLLPGVAARNDFNTGLNVRGGEADQNLILLDGHPLYNPFHLGGLFSTFMDATVSGIEMMTAAFPARYGGRLSSVLDVRSSDEASPGLHGSADVSALGVTARLAGLIRDGQGTWSVAGRRTYADAATRLFTNNIFPYHFRDLHARATYVLPMDVRLAVTGYTGRDVLDANLAAFETDSAASRASEGTWAFDWGNRLAGATLTKDVRRATLEQRVSASGFSTRLDLGEGTTSQRNAIRDLRASGSVLFRTASHDVSVGYDAATYRVRYASGSAQTGTTDFDIRQRSATTSVWLDDVWRLSSRWLVEGGARGDALNGSEYASVSPRLSIKYFVTPSLALTAAGGRVTQWLHSLAGDGPLRYFEIWMASDPFIPVATAWHGVVGAERRMSDVGSVRVEAYVKRYDRLMEANWSEDPSRRGDEFLTAQGTSYGADLLARWQPRSGFSGWVAYSYGLSTRWRDTLRWAPGHDRRHDLNVVATWRVARYQLGTRLGFATGTPYTPIVGSVARRQYDPTTDTWGTGAPILFVEPVGGARNSDRFPATHRVDIDVSREFRARGAVWSPYVSVANAYNAKNVFVYLYQYSTNPPTRRAISQFPILPSAGVRVAF